MTDDQTVESMRVMPNVRTLLADQGVTFDNSFVSYSLCCPSRATFLTGQYAHNHGVWSNAPPNGGYDKLDRTNTLPVWLQRAGYQTIHIGKYLNGYGTQRARPRCRPAGASGTGSRSLDLPLPAATRSTRTARSSTTATPPPSYQTDVDAPKAVDIIARQAADPRPVLPLGRLPRAAQRRAARPGRPDAGWRRRRRRRGTATSSRRSRSRSALFNEADVSDKPAGIRNRPLMTRRRRSPRVRENYQQRLESLLAVDEAVGADRQPLAATGELDNTYIIFTSDNGFFHGEHRVPQRQGAPLRAVDPRPADHPRARASRPGSIGGSSSPTSTSRRRSSRRRARQPGRTMDGRSLLPFARDPLFYSGRDLLLETPTYAAIRTPNWLYAEYVSGERELYNLARDPDELTSLHADPRYARMQANLARRLPASAGAPARSAAGP